METLHGKTGLQGWQWLFIIDFIITFPVAIYGFLCFPDTPHTTKAWWMTEEEKALCLTRLDVHQEHQVMTRASLKVTFKKAFTGYRWVMFTALFMVSATSFEAFGVYAQWQLYMKAHPGREPWPLSKVNYYPSKFALLSASSPGKKMEHADARLPIFCSDAAILTAVAIVFTFVLTGISDYYKNRVFVNYVMFIVVLISCILALNMYTVGTNAMFFAYSLGGIGYAGQASNVSPPKFISST